MLTNKQRIENTTTLTLERRKEIVRQVCKELGIELWGMSEIEHDKFVNQLRDMGYFVPMFDLAVQILIEERMTV